MVFVDDMDDNEKVNEVDEEVELATVDITGDIVKLSMKEFAEVMGVDKLRPILLKLNPSELFSFRLRDKLVDIGGLITLDGSFDNLSLFVLCTKLSAEYIDFGRTAAGLSSLDFIMESAPPDAFVACCCRLLGLDSISAELSMCLD